MFWSQIGPGFGEPAAHLYHKSRGVPPLGERFICHRHGHVVISAVCRFQKNNQKKKKQKKTKKTRNSKSLY